MKDIYHIIIYENLLFNMNTNVKKVIIKLYDNGLLKISLLKDSSILSFNTKQQAKNGIEILKDLNLKIDDTGNDNIIEYADWY